MEWTKTVVEALQNKGNMQNALMDALKVKIRQLHR